MVLGNLYSLGLLIESLEIVLSMNILAWNHSSVAFHLDVALISFGTLKKKAQMSDLTKSDLTFRTMNDSYSELN